MPAQVWDETLAVCHRGDRKAQNRAKARKGFKGRTPRGSRVSGEQLKRAFARSCRGISNFFGLCAWTVGVLLGVASFYAVRRKSYAYHAAASKSRRDEARLG